MGAETYDLLAVTVLEIIMNHPSAIAILGNEYKELKIGSGILAIAIGLLRLATLVSGIIATPTVPAPDSPRYQKFSSLRGQRSFTLREYAYFRWFPSAEGTWGLGLNVLL